MSDKVFIVRSDRSHETVEIEGKSLKDALKQAGLNPLIWKAPPKE